MTAAGLEPALLSELDFESSASTNFAMRSGTDTGNRTLDFRLKA